MNGLVVYAIAASVTTVVAGVLSLLLALALLRQVRRYRAMWQRSSTGSQTEAVSAVVVAWHELIGALPAVPTHRAPRGGGRA